MGRSSATAMVMMMLQKRFQHSPAGEEHHGYQEDDGNQQMAPILEDGPDPGQLVSGQAVHLILVGPQLYLEQDARVVDDGRDNGGGDDHRVFDPQCLRHDEGGGAQ